MKNSNQVNGQFEECLPSKNGDLSYLQEILKSQALERFLRLVFLNLECKHSLEFLPFKTSLHNIEFRSDTFSTVSHVIRQRGGNVNQIFWQLQIFHGSSTQGRAAS